MKIRFIEASRYFEPLREAKTGWKSREAQKMNTKVSKNIFYKGCKTLLQILNRNRVSTNEE